VTTLPPPSSDHQPPQARASLLELDHVLALFAQPGGGAPLRAVNEVSLTVRRGETYALVGESGSGKSTLARLVMGLLEPSAGSIRFDGQQLEKLGASQKLALRRRMQMVFQDPGASLNPRKTVRDVLFEPFIIHQPGVHSKAQLEERATELLETVGLAHEHLGRYPHQFSGGQRQRIAVARALALSPEFLVLDEPTSALDVSVQAQILNLLTDLQRTLGLTYLLITHDMGVVAYLADRVGVMHRGRLVEEGDAEQVLHKPQQTYTQLLLSSIPVSHPSLASHRADYEAPSSPSA
jgi:ABC-type oligopeptide transport system ATPase subunit